MEELTKSIVIASDFDFLPKGVKRAGKELEKKLKICQLLARHEYRLPSRTFLITCRPQDADQIFLIFNKILQSLIDEQAADGSGSDEELIRNKLLARVTYDINGAEIPRGLKEGNEDWPPQVKIFGFKSIWEVDIQDCAMDELAYQQGVGFIETLTSAKIFKDMARKRIYVGAHTQEAVVQAIHKLEVLKRQREITKHHASHIFYTEKEENFQLSIKLFMDIRKKLVKTTLLDPSHNNGATMKSYRALYETCTVRCCSFKRICSSFVLESGEKLFPLVPSNGICEVFQLWRDYIYRTKGNNPVTVQRDYTPPTADCDEDILIPALNDREKEKNVENWILTGMPDEPADTNIQMADDLCYGDKEKRPASRGQLYKEELPFKQLIDSKEYISGNHGAALAEVSLSVRPLTPENTRGRDLDHHRRDDIALGPTPHRKVNSPITMYTGREEIFLPVSSDQKDHLIRHLNDGKEGDLLGLSQEWGGAKSPHFPHQAHDLDLLRLSPERNFKKPTSPLHKQEGNLLGLSPDRKGRISEGSYARDLKELMDPLEGAHARELNEFMNPSVYEMSLVDGGISGIRLSALSPWGGNITSQAGATPIASILQSQSQQQPRPAVQPTIRKDTEVSTRQYHNTMNQKKPNPAAEAKARAGTQAFISPAASNATEYFRSGMIAGIKPIMSNMRWWQGDVVLEAQFGRILLQDLPVQIVDLGEKSSHPFEDVSSLLSRNPQTVSFTKLLSTLPADAQAVLSIKSRENDTLWGPTLERSVTYEFECRYSDSKPFVIEIDADTFETRVKSFPEELGCVYVHGVSRNWDYRVIAMGSTSLDKEYDAVANAIVGSLYIEPNLKRPLLWFKLGTDYNDISFDTIRVCHQSQHLSLDGRSLLNISEVHDLDVDLLRQPESTIYRAHSPDSITQPLWYEMSIRSLAAQLTLQENSALEFAEHCTWTEDTLLQETSALEDLFSPANLLLTKLDGLGFYNDNGLPSPSPGSTASVRTKYTKQQQGPYW